MYNLCVIIVYPDHQDELEIETSTDINEIYIEMLNYLSESENVFCYGIGKFYRKELGFFWPDNSSDEEDMCNDGTNIQCPPIEEIIKSLNVNGLYEMDLGYDSYDGCDNKITITYTNDVS